MLDHIERTVPGCVVALVGYSAGSALTGRMAGDVGQLCGRTLDEVRDGEQFRDNAAARAALAAAVGNDDDSNDGGADDDSSPAWRGPEGRCVGACGLAS